MPQPPIQYADPAFDRVAERRVDASWLARALDDEQSQFTLIASRKHVVTEMRPRWWTPSEVRAVLTDVDTLASASILLGEVDGRARFALEVPEAALAAAADTPPELAGLRDFVADLNSVDATALAYAGALAHWHRGHQFCPVCGTATRSEQAGHVRRCTNADCGRQQFPRTDPAVICLIIDGERALLARRRIWPANRRSTIAGFVEPSETLEQAVAREVFEEVGVRVGRVQYRGSQPWPFPQSLMLGFWAFATTTDIRVDGDEIAEATWYTRAEMRSLSAAEELILPPSDSISRRLVDDWLALDAS